jgi:hypothetical protein
VIAEHACDWVIEMSEPTHRLLVSIDVLSGLATLDELSALLGLSPTVSISHEKGSPRPVRRVWELTVWRLDSGCPGSAPIAEHIGALLKIFPIDRLRGRSRLPQDVQIDLNIGVMEPFFCHTLEIPSGCLKKLGNAGIGMSMAVYAPRSGRKAKRMPRKSSR